MDETHLFFSRELLEASISGVLPFLSDAFDTLCLGERWAIKAFGLKRSCCCTSKAEDLKESRKDVMFGVICFDSSDAFVNVLGVLTWLWLLSFHVILMRDRHCRLELAGNHLSVLALQLEDLQKAEPKEKGCWQQVSMAWPMPLAL